MAFANTRGSSRNNPTARHVEADDEARRIIYPRNYIGERAGTLAEVDAVIRDQVKLHRDLWTRTDGRLRGYWDKQRKAICANFGTASPNPRQSSAAQGLTIND